MDPHDLTLLLAIGAGVISFVSPCVLPLVPAYLGQLAVITVGTTAPSGGRARRSVLAGAAAYVLGFGLVFTILGATASYLAGPLFDHLPFLRQIGGAVLIVMGLGIAGVLPIPILERAWRPLDVPAAGFFQSSGGARRTWAAIGSSFLLGIVFAVGWTPCIGPILGAILTVAATGTTVPQGTALLVAYSAGLAVPFLALALAFDRAPAIVRPLVRRGRIVALVGGLLVTVMGLAIFFNLLFTFNKYFFFGV